MAKFLKEYGDLLEENKEIEWNSNLKYLYQFFFSFKFIIYIYIDLKCKSPLELYEKVV